MNQALRISKTKTIVIVAALMAVFLLPKEVYSHSGRTDSSGGHNCNVGSCAGTYHYHNGGYAPSRPRYIPPPTPDFPKTITGSPSYTHTSNGVNVVFNWNDSSPTGYSIGINSYAAVDPGPLADTNNTSWTFKNISSGKKYVNIKKNIGGRWSRISYWEINVPKWIKPTPKPTIKPTRKPSSTPTPQVKGATDSTTSPEVWLGLGSLGLIAWALNKGRS